MLSNGGTNLMIVVCITFLNNMHMHLIYDHKQIGFQIGIQMVILSDVGMQIPLNLVLYKPKI